MKIYLKRLEKKELDSFIKAHDESFSVHDKYFADGVVPGPTEEEGKEYFYQLFNDSKTVFLGIYDEDKYIGGAIVCDDGDGVFRIELFYLIIDYQSKGIGKIALDMVEEYFPNAKVFRLITPTQVVRNSVFYINKCGYKIVKVIDFNKEENTADYLFEKIVG